MSSPSTSVGEPERQTGPDQPVRFRVDKAEPAPEVDLKNPVKQYCCSRLKTVAVRAIPAKIQSAVYFSEETDRAPDWSAQGHVSTRITSYPIESNEMRMLRILPSACYFEA